MSKGALEDAKLYYALAVNTRRVDFDDLCDEIAETCTLTSADIKAVLDRVIWAMVSHLKNSELVQFGDLGNFRISVGSTGSATPDPKSLVLRCFASRRWCSIRASACRKCAMSPSLPATPSIKTMAQKAAACKPSPVMIPASPKSGQLDQLLPGSRFVFISMPTQSDTSDIQLTFFSYTTCLLQHHVYDYKKQSVHLSCLMRTY